MSKFKSPTAKSLNKCFVIPSGITNAIHLIEVYKPQTLIACIMGSTRQTDFNADSCLLPEHNVAIKVSIMGMHTVCVTTLYNWFQIWIQTLISPRWHWLYLMRQLGIASQKERALPFARTSVEIYVQCTIWDEITCDKTYCTYPIYYLSFAYEILQLCKD